MITRIIGALLILAALVAAGFELVNWISAGSYKAVTLGGIWFAVHKASLNAAQAGIQRYVAPWLWDPAIMWVLVQPAWATLGVPGALLLWLGRPRKRRRRRRFRRD
ncbi:MAG: hypothetical protein R3229_07715 [Alphaproteobacteria bacterium]|nr:hypothetical protein [Alphaproteobacteria bacterium]